jgi:hypothetical protein
MPNDPKFPHFDYFEVEFTAAGTVANRQQLDNLIHFLHESPSTTDLLVMSHGWNNDMNDARSLYLSFFGFLRRLLDNGKPVDVRNRKFTVLAILWPSKKFADADLIPSNVNVSGSAGAAAGVTTRGEVPQDILVKKLSVFEAALANPDAAPQFEEARTLVPTLANFPSKQRRFVDLIRSVLPQTTESITVEDASSAFFKLDAIDLINRLSGPMPITSAQSAGDLSAGAQSADQGSAAGLGDILSGIKGSFIHLLNYTTYYVMKDRAGTVGRTGVYQVLREVRDDFPTLKIHLMGHSFGGRLVTAATDGPIGKPSIRPETMTLLQAAFSHNGFAHLFDGVHDGFFRAVVTGKKVVGPILITCSKQDSAVGIAYPIASLLSGVTAAALGDKNDPFGGIGRNGAQKTPESVDNELLPAPGQYSFTRGKLFNLNGDAIITGHGDICRDEIASAILQAIALT